MSSGGGAGYANSTTSNIPWEHQAESLAPLFRTGMAGMFGRDPITNKAVDDDNIYSRMFQGLNPDGQVVPGKLEYIGDKNNLWGGEGLNAISNGTNKGLGSSTLNMTAAPTVAAFTPEELIAQNIIKQRLKGDDFYQGYNTGYTDLIPQAKTALGNIVTGQNKINPASYSAANVSAPSTIDSPNIYAPGGYSTPTIENTNLDYKFWNPLGSMAGGNENNDYLESMISTARGNMWNDYQNYGVPGLDNTAEAAGRYGGNTWGTLRGDLYDKTSKNAGQIESTMRGEAYNSDMNRALQAMNLGGTLAESQSGLSANKALNQAQLEAQNQSQRYNTQADINKLVGQLGLQADTSQAGNELTRNTQNALLSQEANQGNAGFQQQANTQNVANVMQGSQVAPGVSQSDYADIAALAGVGEAQGAKQQDIIDAFIKRFETNQNEPNVRLANMSNLLSGNFGGTTTSRAPATSSGGCF